MRKTYKKKAGEKLVRREKGKVSSVLLSCLRFFILADPTISEPETGYKFIYNKPIKCLTSLNNLSRKRRPFALSNDRMEQKNGRTFCSSAHESHSCQFFRFSAIFAGPQFEI